MNWRLPTWRLSTKLAVAVAAALLLALAGANLLPAAPAKKKHPAPAAKHSTAQAHKSGGTTPGKTAAGRTSAGKATTAPARKTTTAAGKGTRSRRRSRVRYYAGPRIDPARKAELVEEIGAQLKEPAAKAIAYGSALDGFYAQLASYESSLHAAELQTSTVRVLQFGDSQPRRIRLRARPGASSRSSSATAALATLTPAIPLPVTEFWARRGRSRRDGRRRETSSSISATGKPAWAASASQPRAPESG